jgi:hypothetical protein
MARFSRFVSIARSNRACDATFAGCVHAKPSLPSTDKDGLQAQQAVRARHRTQERDKHTLKPYALKLITRALEELRSQEQATSGRPSVVSSNMTVEFMLGTCSASTANAHAGYVEKWSAYCVSAGMTDFPTNAFEFARFLSGEAEGNQTAAPTQNRCSAISWASKLFGHPNPCEAKVVLAVRQGLAIKLGFKREQKSPLMQEHVQKIFHLHDNQEASLQEQLSYLKVAAGVEGSLRHDDLTSISMGSIVVISNTVRVFLASTKTDKFREGQWATLAFSLARESFSQRLLCMVDVLKKRWEAFSVETRRGLLEQDLGVEAAREVDLNGGQFLDEISLACVTQEVRAADGKSTVSFPRFGFKNLVTSQEFSAVIKGWAHSIGLDPKLFASHSLKVGSIHSAAEAGVPDRLIKKMGRWRSETMLAHYIGEARSMRELTDALTTRWPRSEISTLL